MSTTLALVIVLTFAFVVGRMLGTSLPTANVAYGAAPPSLGVKAGARVDAAGVPAPDQAVAAAAFSAW